MVGRTRATETQNPPIPIHVNAALIQETQIAQMVVQQLVAAIPDIIAQSNTNANPGNANPGNVNLGNANPGNANPCSVNLGNANPCNAHPGNVNLGNSNPGNTDSGNVNLDNANPGNANQGNANLGNEGNIRGHGANYEYYEQYNPEGTRRNCTYDDFMKLAPTRVGDKRKWSNNMGRRFCERLNKKVKHETIKRYGGIVKERSSTRGINHCAINVIFIIKENVER
ncbi:hypothetical protein L1987_02105 [Smallanthus sonchifolius]|uniref:Uncharacterized protein n=1 Tax=Smallanthus sonchifolius TaxID=185202 RepID=A0ACB9K6T5_9ASTR|nr:hypothetical protein L1987_02105 [Smallanthus sonchifolius]